MIWGDKNIKFEVDEKEVEDIYNNPNKFFDISKKAIDDARNIKVSDNLSITDVVYFEKRVTLAKRDFKKLYPDNIITLDINLANTILIKDDILLHNIDWSIRRFMYGRVGNIAVGGINVVEISNLLQYRKFIEIINNKKIIQQHSIPLNNISNKELLTEDEQAVILKYFNNGTREFINLALELIYRKDIQENDHILMTILAKTSNLYRINNFTKGKRFLVKFKGRYPGLRI